MTRLRANAPLSSICSVIAPGWRATTGYTSPAIARLPKSSASCGISNSSGDLRGEYHYNNLCYNVAGLLIERLSGQSYEAFIRARLTDRLGMSSRL